MEKCYSTDLSDAEWECLLEVHVPSPNRRGRPRTHSTREIFNAIFYILKSGCPWRLLPKDFPPWETVYWWFGRWRVDGTFEQLNAALRERLRNRLGRNPLPRAQVSPTPSLGQEHRGRRRTEGIRRKQEGSRQEAAPLVGHRGIGTQGEGPQREGPRDQDGLRLLLQSAPTGLSSRQRGGVRVCGHGPFDGEAPSPWLRISKQFLERLSGN